MRPPLALALAATAVAVAIPTAASSARPNAAAARPGRGPCPTRIDRVPYRRDAAARRRLVFGRPDRLVLCRYTGLTRPDPQGLRRWHAVGGPRHVRRLAHRLNQLPPFSSGPIACPADFGETLLARFRYPHAPDDYVKVGLSGCRLATNGPRTRLTSGHGGAALVRALERLSR